MPGVGEETSGILNADSLVPKSQPRIPSAVSPVHSRESATPMKILFLRTAAEAEVRLPLPCVRGAGSTPSYLHKHVANSSCELTVGL